MTSTTDEANTLATDPGTGEGVFGWVPVGALAPHPDNPRSDLGDVTELVRSVRSQGVLEPLLVLPADEVGWYLIVAGHRRHLAAVEAGLEQVPAVVRAMSPVEVVEAMLSENVNRDELSVGDEVRAIERLLSLDGGLSPAKLCRRIGKSQAWVRTRMAVTALPERWRRALDKGVLTLAAGEAAAGAADLGPEHVDALCEELAGRRHGTPAVVVERYRERLRRDAAFEEAVETERATGVTVLSEKYEGAGTKPVADLFRPETVEQHRSEPCHAVAIWQVSWGQGFDRREVCTEPRRHHPDQVAGGKASSLEADGIDWERKAQAKDNSRAKRQGRLARLGHAQQVWARSRGGISQAQLVEMAQRALVLDAGADVLGFAAMILGYERPKDVTARVLLDQADTPAKLARLAGAVACGMAEARMSHGHGSAECQAYLRLLCDTGWTPDDWTAQVLRTDPSEPAASDGTDGDTPDDDQAGDDPGAVHEEAEPGDGPEAGPEGPEATDECPGREAPEGADEYPGTEPGSTQEEPSTQAST